MDSQLIGLPGSATQSPFIDQYVPAAETGQHIVPILTGADEDQQEAEMAVALHLGSVPQLPDQGVDWAGYVAGTLTFGKLNAQIRKALNDAGHTDYKVDYTIVDGELHVTVSKATGG